MKVRSVIAIAFITACAFVAVWRWAPQTDRLPKSAGDKPRIVSLSPAITETLFALGVGDSVVGVDERSDYPPEAAKIARVGSGMSPDLEAIGLRRPSPHRDERAGGDERDRYDRANLHVQLARKLPWGIAAQTACLHAHRRDRRPPAELSRASVAGGRPPLARKCDGAWPVSVRTSVQRQRAAQRRGLGPARDKLHGRVDRAPAGRGDGAAIHARFGGQRTSARAQTRAASARVRVLSGAPHNAGVFSWQLRRSRAAPARPPSAHSSPPCDPGAGATAGTGERAPCGAGAGRRTRA